MDSKRELGSLPQGADVAKERYLRNLAEIEVKLTHLNPADITKNGKPVVKLGFANEDGSEFTPTQRSKQQYPRSPSFGSMSLALDFILTNTVV